MGKELIKGSQALGEAALRAGCRFYFGSPTPPQNEVPEYLSVRLPQVGGTFVQAESDLAAVNMVIGAAMAGARVMTSSSSPGISLMQEGISHLAGQELPAVIANLSRGGPGLGNISPAQSDYFQAAKGGGHGDYRLVVLAPQSVQELYDLTGLAFDLADKYRNPVMILGDGLLNGMMEPVTLAEMKDPDTLPPKDWALTGARGRPGRAIRSLLTSPKELEAHNFKLTRKYDFIKRSETLWDSFMCDDAQMVLAAFGSAARIAKEAIQLVRGRGLKVGLFRPRTLWPFPHEPIFKLADRVKHFLVFELNTGQMKEDVELAVKGCGQVEFYGRPGGIVPTPDDVAHQITHHYYAAHLGEPGRLGCLRGGPA